MKHLKNLQQIDYATDHGNSYADRERNSPSLFLRISQMLNVSTFGNMADIYAIVHLVPHTCQHITVNQSQSSVDSRGRGTMHRQPSSRNFAYHFLRLLKTGAAYWNSARNRRCTVTTDEVLAYSKTKNYCSSLLNAIFATTVS